LQYYLSRYMPDKMERMLQLVGEFFDVKNDPEQLNITEEVMGKLMQINPSTMVEYNEGDGPIVWIIIIPVKEGTMNRFLKGEISEGKLLDEIMPGDKLDAIYLCSASVLPEYRRRGLAKKLTVDAITEIRKAYPVKKLFYWSFSPEGDALAASIAKAVNLPLYKRQQ